LAVSNASPSTRKLFNYGNHLLGGGTGY
jgi:hypothetical protein